MLQLAVCWRLRLNSYRVQEVKHQFHKDFDGLDSS
jgi:hypothetical protein